jgi:signal transduction histidine kinase
VYASSAFGSSVTIQVLVSFVIPVVVMLLFWRAARKRLLRHEESMTAALRLEQAQNRATAQFLVDVAHELPPHQSRCSARDAALAVAADYREAGADLKVAVPDVEIETDPHILRQILHVLVGNAIRHGGGRVAIWAVSEGHSFRLSVSDDGAGLPPAVEDAVFDRYVDLAGSAGKAGRPGTSLIAARVLGEKIGAELGYRRDTSWSHFSVSLPLEVEVPAADSDLVPLEAGVS